MLSGRGGSLILPLVVVVEVDVGLGEVTHFLSRGVVYRSGCSCVLEGVMLMLSGGWVEGGCLCFSLTILYRTPHDPYKTRRVIGEQGKNRSHTVSHQVLV